MSTAHTSGGDRSHQEPRPNTIPAAAKWIQENDESDNDQVGLVPHNRGYKHILFKWTASEAQFGGNKLRTPRKLAEESEYIKAGKKRTIVKRKKRRLEDELSEEEEDPYTLVNIEAILSPIESPTDIVRRPALRRIIQSRQVEGLAKTSMEFIEGEKNFNKIMCRLCAILHHDDPRYLDVSFERTPEERRSRHVPEASNENKTPELNGQHRYKGNASHLKLETKKEDNEEGISHLLKDKQGSFSMEEGHSGAGGGDVEAQEVVRRVKELLLENINFSNEYLARLQGARDKLYKAHMQKDALWAQLCAVTGDQDRRHAYRDNSNTYN
ncbi:hypothetical protein BDF14DRAFT_1891757 [Spinellus fusiger]|nr:hypothetical protein BDF14DRAFT_1891757 [Spinellus fusiger]